MTTVRLTGMITRKGKLEITLPDGLPPGEVEVVIEFSPRDTEWEDRPWSDEELRELLRIEPKTGAEIVANLAEGWEDRGITDSAAWVEELRRKRREWRRP